MTTNTNTTATSVTASQPEALRLAEVLENFYMGIGRIDATSAAAELRRLHALTTAAPAASWAASPLTADQIKSIHHDLCTTTGANYLSIARAIEAAHGIAAEAPAAQEAEPAARDRHLDLLSDVLDAKEAMRAAGCKQADFATMFDEFRATAAAPRPQADAVAVPEGWRLVPVEPTGVMKDTGAFHLPVSAGRPWAAADCYRAMIEAAPQAPAAPAAASDVLEVVLHAFEQKERGRLSATIAATLVEELRASMAALAPAAAAEQAPAPAAGAAPSLDDLTRTMHITEHHGTVLPDGRTLGAWSRSYYAPMPAPDAPTSPWLIGVDMAGGPDATAYRTVTAAPTDAMVDAYLLAQRRAVEEADRFGRPNIGGLHKDTVREACRAGLAAALGAAAPAQEAEDGWMPIETAPKDGTEIDLFNRGGHREAGAFWGLPPHECGEMGRYCDSDWHGYEPGWVTDFWGEPQPDSTFSHWRRKPAPPAARARQEGQA